MYMIKEIYNYFKYRRIFRDVLNNTQFIEALSMSFGVEFNRDKLDRLYTVINPYIQNMGNPGNSIIYDGDNKPIVDKWVVDNFLIIDKVIKNHDIFDIISYNIEKIDDDMNFLLVIQNALLPTATKCFKRLGIIAGVLILLVLVILAILI